MADKWKLRESAEVRLMDARKALKAAQQVFQDESDVMTIEQTLAYHFRRADLLTDMAAAYVMLAEVTP